MTGEDRRRCALIFLAERGCSNRRAEGVMCIGVAERTQRFPDDPTRDVAVNRDVMRLWCVGNTAAHSNVVNQFVTR